MNTVLTNAKHYSFKKSTLVGFFDSDGGFNTRLTKRKNNKIGFSLAVAFTQKTQNNEILHKIANQLGTKAKILDKITGVVKRTGEPKRCSVLSFGLTTLAGTKFFNILKKHPSFCPSKFLDFQITSIFLECLQNKYILKCVDQLVPSGEVWSNETKEKVSLVACVYLWFKMSNQSNEASRTRKRETTVEDWLNYLSPTDFELEQGQKIYEQYFTEIQQKVAKLEKYLHKKNVCLPKPYIVGFFIGDGCLTISLKFSKNRPRTSRLSFIVPNLRRRKPKKQKHFFTTTVGFSLIENISNKSLCKGFLSTLKQGRIIHNRGTNTCRYQLTGWRPCREVVLPLLDNQNLPDFRQHQFQQFKKALSFGEFGRYRSVFGISKFIDIIYDMNKGGVLRRQSKESLILLANHYIQRETNRSFLQNYILCKESYWKNLYKFGQSSKPFTKQLQKWDKKYIKRTQKFQNNSE